MRSVYRFHILLVFTCETLRKQFLVLRKGFFSCGHIEYQANPQVARKPTYQTKMDNLVFRAWLPSYPGLVTNVNHFTALNHQSRNNNFPAAIDFVCSVFFSFLFFAAAVGHDENLESSKKVLPFLRRE